MSELSAPVAPLRTPSKLANAGYSVAADTTTALQRLQRIAITNGIREKLTASRLRISLIAALGLILWGGMFFLFWEGFSFLSQHRMIAGPLIEMLFRLFFTSILVMLIFSTGIILYASLFASREAEFLLIQPVSTDRIFFYKFQEAMFFSCWGFFLLGSPLILSYGITAKVPLHFYVLAGLYFITYAFIPGSLGAILCLYITYFFPKRRIHIVATVATAIVTVVGWRLYHVWRTTSSLELSPNWINLLTSKMSVAYFAFLPSDWITRGLLDARFDDGIRSAFFYLAVLLSNSLFIYLLAAWSYAGLYRTAYNRVQSESFAQNRRASPILSSIVERIFSPLPMQARILILKDIRVFLRDPLQWSQVLIFMGLLLLYFLNLGRNDYYSNNIYWKNLIGFFNLAVTGLLLASFTSRFIYPLLSLEGQKFWILGLCPISREAVLWSKYAFATGGAIISTFFLVLLGGFMLGLSPMLIAIQLLTVVILCSGVSAIAVGLGACFPDMKETDPSKIAAGFGGTLNLVVSLIFIVLVVGTMALPCHLYSITLAPQEVSVPIDPTTARKAIGLSYESFVIWMSVSVLSSLAIGVAATIIPMKLGVRAFKSMEF